MIIEAMDSREREVNKPLVVAGPCSAESEEQVMNTAVQLAAMGIKMFRAGIWKPRTKPGCFEGVGVTGLPWMQRVQRETGMKVITEVANAKHVEAVLAAGFEYVWIGARTTANPFAVQEIAEALQGTGITVFVKNPVNPDLELWIGAMERLNHVGINKLVAVHRGFSSYEKKIYRNPPQWQIPIELRRRFPELPLFCDPSHIAGKREWVPTLCRQAMSLGFNGLFVESHCNPQCALSDASQQLLPQDLKALLDSLVMRHEDESVQLLDLFREQMDDYDNALIEILTKRMKLSREIAHIKQEHNITILQTNRYNELLNKRAQQASDNGISADCIKKIFEAIHTESIHQQMGMTDDEK